MFAPGFNLGTIMCNAVAILLLGLALHLHRRGVTARVINTILVLSGLSVIAAAVIAYVFYVSILSQLGSVAG